MNWVILAMMGPVLVWIAVQDIRERRISLVALFLLFGLGTIYAGLVFNWSEVPEKILANSLFGSLILVSGTLLVKIRKPWDRVSSFIGAGDFLFLLAISPMFSFGSFLVFLNTSIITTLILFGILRLRNTVNKNVTIPLAGAFAICLGVFLSIDQMLPIDLLIDVEWIYSLYL